jgi:hypothetical protein
MKNMNHVFDIWSNMKMNVLMKNKKKLRNNVMTQWGNIWGILYEEDMTCLPGTPI